MFVGKNVSDQRNKRVLSLLINMSESALKKSPLKIIASLKMKIEITDTKSSKTNTFKFPSGPVLLDGSQITTKIME